MIIDTFLETFSNAADQLTQYLPISLGFIALLFGIHILNTMMGHRLNFLGIWPRKKFGWIGIPFSPFLHGNLPHLMFNMIPLFVFSNFILLQGDRTFYIASVYMIVMSGVLTWLFGRRGIHVGASALIMGYLGFIVVGIYHRPTVLSVVIGAVCIFYFGGIFMNLLPSSDKRVSWEGHIFGFVSGIVAAYVI